MSLLLAAVVWAAGCPPAPPPPAPPPPAPSPPTPLAAPPAAQDPLQEGGEARDPREESAPAPSPGRPPELPESYLSWEETLQATGTDEQELKRLVGSGELPGYRTARSIAFKRDEVRAWLERHPR